MHIQTKVTIVGVFAGIAVVAFASSGACNHAVTHSCKERGSYCFVKSPNCPDNSPYRGAVKDTTDRTGVAGGGPGYTVWINGPSTCTYICEIIQQDCFGEYPLVEENGGYHKIPGGGFVPCE